MEDVLDNEPARWLRPSRPVAIALALLVVLAAATWVTQPHGAFVVSQHVSAADESLVF